MKVLIIIPAYNEEEALKNVVDELILAAPEVDYLVINDCSTDGTEQICKDNGFSYISLSTNLGIGGGVQTGYLYALENDYDIAIQMDGDGQHDPRYLREMIRIVAAGEADLVIGSRFLRKEGYQSTAVRRLGICFLSLLVRQFSGVWVKDVTSGYRAVNRKLIEVYSRSYAQDYPEPEAIITAVMYGAAIKEIPMEMHERIGGHSSIGIMKSLYFMIKVSLAIILYMVTFSKGDDC